MSKPISSKPAPSAPKPVTYMPVITEADAQALNDRVRNEIDSRLFLCCNYVPTPVTPCHDDGFCFKAIQDLYNFAYDSSCIIKNYDRLLYPAGEPDAPPAWYQSLKETVSNISLLRSILSHNQHDLNGSRQSKRLSNYNHLMRQWRIFSPPNSDVDYGNLKRKLADMAKALLTGLGGFIDGVKANPRKQDIVNEWIVRTTHWYCGSAKQEIYLGYLESEYQSRIRWPMALPAGFKPPTPREKTKAWIKSQLTHPIEDEISILQDEWEEAEKCRKFLISTLPTATPQSKIEPINAGIEEIKKRIKAKEVELKELEDKIHKDGDLISHFFCEVEKKNELLTLADSATPPLSLLPQGLLQKHIEHSFSLIPSPYGEF